MCCQCLFYRFYNGVKAKQSLVEDIKHIMANQTCGSDGSSAFELMAQALRESTQVGLVCMNAAGGFFCGSGHCGVVDRLND